MKLGLQIVGRKRRDVNESYLLGVQVVLDYKFWLL